MLLLDLFCGAGGASMGYSQAGFEVVGVDIAKQKRYPFRFIQADAMEILEDEAFIRQFDLVHASPPCQRYSSMTRRWGTEDNHPDLVGPVRERLQDIDVAFVIENVPGAPLIDPVVLCGSMFKLGVRRHRLFEATYPIEPLDCDHASQGKVVGVYGHAGGSSNRDGITFSGTDVWRAAMGIDWMTGKELAESVPPAYTEYIGRQFLGQV